MKIMVLSRRRNGGFTLLELLVALTLVGLILVQLFGGLRLASRAWDGVGAQAARTEELRLASTFLRRALMQAGKVNWSVNNRSSILFWGNGSQVEFVMPLSEFVGQGGTYLVRVARVDRGERGDLVLQRWLLHPDVLDGDVEVPAWEPLRPIPPYVEEGDAAQGAFGTHVLLSDVGELRFSYFGQAENQGGEAPNEWTTEWRERNRLPLLVKLELDENAQWPAIVVRLTGE